MKKPYVSWFFKVLPFKATSCVDVKQAMKSTV